MKYIGIRGHRGAGKNSISFLLGQTLEVMLCGHRFDADCAWFDKYYKAWCECLMINPNYYEECSSNIHVYYESFSDNIKIFIRMLLGCPDEYLQEDFYKDNIVVNLKDFSCKNIEDISDCKLWTAESLYNDIDKVQDPQPITKNTYLTLREFILYFGMEVMQRFFGCNVWTKSLKATSEEWDRYLDNGNSFKIYTDLKTPAEATYIKQNNGIIVNVVRPSNRRGQSGLDKLGKDDRIDYTVTVNGDLYSTKSRIIEISNDIINRLKNGKETEQED